MAELNLPETIAALDEQEATVLLALGKLSAQLDQIRTARAALLALQNDEPLNFEGKLADAIRTVLRNNAPQLMAPTHVRAAIQALGYDLRQHSNPMASIHSVLKRMADAGNGDVKAKLWRGESPGLRYYWAGPDQSMTLAALAGLTKSHPQMVREALLKKLAEVDANPKKGENE